MAQLAAATTGLLSPLSLVLLSAAAAAADDRGASPWLAPGILIILVVVVTPLLSHFLHGRRSGRGGGPDIE